MKAKSWIQSILILCTMVLSAPTMAVEFIPHAGADYKFWQVEPKQADAANNFIHIFPDITRAGAFYVGTRINKNWGIDVGYERSSRKDKFRNFDSMDFVFDQFSNIGDASEVDVQLSAWYLSGLFYWEVYNNLELIFHAGIASLQPKSSIIYYPFNSGPIDLRFKLESKASGRFGFGVQYLFLKYLGVRALVTFDQTKRINYVGVNQSNIPFDISPYKSATSYNLGMFAEFDII